MECCLQKAATSTAAVATAATEAAEALASNKNGHFAKLRLRHNNGSL